MASNYLKFQLYKEAVLREARNNFYAYRKLINPKNTWGWWQKEISEELQSFTESMLAGERPKLVIQAPPQHGKSTQIVDYISWMAGRNPDFRTIYTSFSERLGIRANLKLQRLYDSEIYKEVFPDTRINGSNVVTISGQYLRNREILEYVGHAGFFRNTTVKGSITGESLDLGVIDDPIRGRADANSEAMRDAAWNWFTDDFFTRFSEKAGLLAILTRWHIDDPIGRLINADPDIRVLTYQAIATKDEDHRKAGEPLFPELKSKEFLEERKQVMSHSHWEALYQQNPTIQEGNLFKPDRMDICDAMPDVTAFVRAWDLAGTEKSMASHDPDWTVGAKVGLLRNGRWILSDIVRLRGTPEEVESAIVNTAKRDGTNTRIWIPQDPGQAGKAQVAYLTRQLSGFSVSSNPVSGDKVTRAEPFAAQVNVGNVSMLRAPWNDALVAEMRVFPNGTHDDQIDALSDAFSNLNNNTFGMLEYMRRQVEAMNKGV